MTTISLKLCTLPSYLHAGEFYRSLDNEDLDGVIEVPTDCFKEDGTWAANLDEFRQLLRVLTFWMLDEIPSGVLNFCSRNEVAVWQKIMSDVPGVHELNLNALLVKAYPRPDIIPINDILDTDRWDLIIHVVGQLDRDSLVTVNAAERGHLRLLKHLHERGFPWADDTTAAASGNGHVDCLQYALDNSCPWDDRVYALAAQKGHFECLKCAHQRDVPWHSNICMYSALYGQLECLQYAHENGCPWDSRVHVVASSNGHLNCMQYAFEQGLAWHPYVCKFAASGGHLQCLQYAHEHSCPWDSQTVASAAQKGHTECLRYALANNCPVDEEACNQASQVGQLACLQLLGEFGAPWSSKTAVLATACADPACLQYLHDSGCPWDETTTNHAAMHGHIAPLRYALGEGCPYPERLVANVAYSCSLEGLRYLVEEELMGMDELAFTFALLRGSLPCVQYLVDHGCPFEEVKFVGDKSGHESYDLAFKKDNPEFVLCVDFLVWRGWPIDENFINYFAPRDDLCREWLIKKGYDLP